jgi:hypothetical protein
MENENSQAIEDRKFENKVCVVSGCTAEVEVGQRDMQQQFYRARYKYEKRFEGGEALLNAVMQTCAEAVEQTIKDTAGNVEGVSADRQG